MCSPRQDVLSRMIINLQDAGFRTNYSSIYWTYASGFPKAANVSKLIDKKAGAEQEIIGKREDGRYKSKFNPDVHFRNQTYNASVDLSLSKNIDKIGLITKPATEEAKKMEGAYVGFQPKPAVEVILVVSKGKTLTWLDDCRIPYQSEDDLATAKEKMSPIGQKYAVGAHEGFQRQSHEDYKVLPINEKGRFPANLLVSDDVLNDGRITKSSTDLNRFKTFRYRDWCQNMGYDKIKKPTHPVQVGGSDEGSYSRYFSLDSWWAKTFPFLIVPKASKSERGEFNRHPTVKALKLMSYLITMGSREGDLVLDPFCGSGTVCIAADQLHRKWIGIEKNPEYAEIIKRRLMVPLSQLKLSVYS